MAESSEQLVWGLDLDVKSDSAEEGAAALEKLRDAIQGGTAELREMQTALRNLKGSALASDETIKGLKDRVAASKATLAGNTLELVKNKDAFAKTPAALTKANEALKAQQAASKKSTADAKALATTLKVQSAESFKRSRIEAASMAKTLKDDTAKALKQTQAASADSSKALGMFSGRIKELMALGPAALCASIAVAMVAIAGAAIGATIALVGYAIAQADARRSDLLRLEGLSKVRNYWLEMVTGQRRAADSSAFLQKTIDGVAAGSSLSRDRIGEMTSELYRAGLRGQRLKDGLEGLAIVEATQGKESGAAFKARALGAQIYGTSIKALTNDVKTRLGPTAKAMMLSLDVQSQKAHENIAHLFDGIKIEKFLEGLSKITEMFSQNTATGRALKALVETLLQPLIDGVSTAGPIIKKFFQGVVIGALVMAITIYKVRNALRDTFAGSDFAKNINLTTIAVNLGVFAFGAFATAVAIALVFCVALGAGLAALVGSLVYAGVWVWNFASSVIDAMHSIGKGDWNATGLAVTRGIAAGITGGASEVIIAITNLGGDALKAFRKKLGIASPSKEAFKASIEVPRGMVQAHKAGRGMVRASAEQLGAAAEQGLRAGGGGARAGGVAAAMAGGGAPAAAVGAGRAPVTVHIGNLTIGAGQSPEQIKESLREAVEEIFERTAHTMGASL